MGVTVLVSGGGGAAAISTIKSLRMGGFDGRIVATDSEPLSAGLYLADAFQVVPRAKDPAFYPTLKRLIDDEGIEVIFPTSGFDIYQFARHKRELEAMGTVVAMSDLDAMTTCENKWAFYLETHGAFPLPETGRNPASWSRFPCFVKPTFGKGSRGTHRCLTRGELEFHTAGPEDLLIQEYLPGEEYTVDVLSDLSGTPLLAVPRVRLETDEGISCKGKVVRDGELERLCLELARHLGLKGPTCMQLKRDEAGRPKFMEVNPRIGGGAMFTTLAGVNIPMLLLDVIAGTRIAPPTPREIIVLRYYEEVVLDSACGSSEGEASWRRAEASAADPGHVLSEEPALEAGFPRRTAANGHRATRVTHLPARNGLPIAETPSDPWPRSVPTRRGEIPQSVKVYRTAAVDFEGLERAPLTSLVDPSSRGAAPA